MNTAKSEITLKFDGLPQAVPAENKKVEITVTDQNIEPVHCLGLTELQIKTLLVSILDGFSQHSGLKIEHFRSLR